MASKPLAALPAASAGDGERSDGVGVAAAERFRPKVRGRAAARKAGALAAAVWLLMLALDFIVDLNWLVAAMLRVGKSVDAAVGRDRFETAMPRVGKSIEEEEEEEKGAVGAEAAEAGAGLFFAACAFCHGLMLVPALSL